MERYQHEKLLNNSLAIAQDQPVRDWKCINTHEIFMRRCRDKFQAPDERTFASVEAFFFAFFSRSWKAKLLEKRYVKVSASLKWWCFFSGETIERKRNRRSKIKIQFYIVMFAYITRTSVGRERQWWNVWEGLGVFAKIWGFYEVWRRFWGFQENMRFFCEVLGIFANILGFMAIFDCLWEGLNFV